MKIGLDYDGTITAAPELWLAFYYTAIAQGHEVVVVTMRHPEEAVEDFPAKVIYTGRKAKKLWCDKQGIDIDIWIDDRPAWLFQDSA